MKYVFNFSVRLIILIFVCSVVVYFYPRYAHLVILLIALILIILGAGNILPYWLVRKWQRHEAVITIITEAIEKVPESQYSLKNYYYPLINYHYQYNGQDYDSDKVSFEIENIWLPECNAWGDKLDEKEKFWHGWTQGTIIPIYINTAVPSESVVINRLSKKRRSHHYAVISAGVAILILWAVLRYVGL